MIETVEQLIEILNKQKGNRLFMKDISKQTISYLFEVEEENGVCYLVKSVRDYPNS